MSAPDFTAEQQARLQRFEMADDAPESLLHKVAVAIEAAYLNPVPNEGPATYGHLAAAAIEAVKAGQP